MNWLKRWFWQYKYICELEDKLHDLRSYNVKMGINPYPKEFNMSQIIGENHD